MSFTRTLLSAAVIGIAFGAVAVSSVTVELVHRETLSLPSLAPLSGAIAASTSRILASDGSSMGAFASQDRDPVSISNIPKLVQNAFVASEDRNFWKNDGIDPLAIARAFVTDVRMRGTDRRAIGASTITQQVVKNFIVGDQKTLIRKVREALLAVRLDKEIGKPRILEIYLNEIYLGEAAYGVSAAAEAYFGKPLVSLDLAEAALIGGMPKGPKNYDPLRHPDAARGRRSYVLNRMFEDGYITATQEAEADREPLPTPSPHLMSGTADDFFAEEVRRETVAALGSAVFYSGGLTVQTSEVPALQKLAEKSLRDGLIAYDRRHGWRGPVGVVPAGTDLSTPSSWREALMEVDAPAGADDWSLGVVLGYTAAGDGVVGFADGSTAALTLHSLQWARPVVGSGLGNIPTSVTQVVHPGDVVLTSIDSQGELHLQQIPAVEGSLIAMNVHTGQVVAIAGGFSFAGGSFDRAVQSERQPGSAFKPFVYLTAFEHGYDPTSPLLDSPIAIDTGSGDGNLWRPGADGGTGWGLITARRALENSRNYASVRLLYDLGLNDVGQTAAKFGLYKSLPNYAAALGALEVSDLRLTTAYAMLANGGHSLTPSLIDSINNANGTLIARRAPAVMDETTRIADPIAVAQLTSVLVGVVRSGTAAIALAKIPLPIAGKTGTTNDNVDAWFVGFTPDLAVGVHIGFDQPKPLGETEYGGPAAAPVFGEFVQGALTLYPPSVEAFPVPPGATLMRVDPISGQPSATGVEEIIRDAPKSIADAAKPGAD